MKISDFSEYQDREFFEFVDSEEEVVFRFIKGSDRPVYVGRLEKDESGKIEYNGYYLKTQDFIRMAKMMLTLLEN